MCRFERAPWATPHHAKDLTTCQRTPDDDRKQRAQQEAMLAIQDTARLKQTALFQMADDGIRGACVANVLFIGGRARR